MANLFFRTFTSKFKFPIFKFTIVMVWNNSVTLSICITFVDNSSIDFGVLICVIGFLNPFAKDPSLCTNILPSPNSNVYPSENPFLLIGTYNFGGMNITKGGCVSILIICSPLAYRPCVCCWCCKCCGLPWLSIQFS